MDVGRRRRRVGAVLSPSRAVELCCRRLHDPRETEGCGILKVLLQMLVTQLLQDRGSSYCLGHSNSSSRN